MQKLALGVEYDGSMYCGWQKQKDVSSIQDRVEQALCKVTSESISVFCSGRTDSGVHALGQVVHFETRAKYPESAWILGVNRYLPNDICIRWVSVVNKNFHARISALSRRYYYVIYNHKIRSAILFQKVWHFNKELNVHKMLNAAQCLLGEHDFSSFKSSGCQSVSACRKLYHLDIVRRGNCIIIDIKANSFVYHMVRNIVGSLVEVGCGYRSESWIAELLSSGDRSLAGVTAPASGLYLVEIEYPSCFSIPSVGVEEFLKGLYY